MEYLKFPHIKQQRCHCVTSEVISQQQLQPLPWAQEDLLLEFQTVMKKSQFPEALLLTSTGQSQLSLGFHKAICRHPAWETSPSQSKCNSVTYIVVSWKGRISWLCRNSWRTEMWRGVRCGGDGYTYMYIHTYTYTPAAVVNIQPMDPMRPMKSVGLTLPRQV